MALDELKYENDVVIESNGAKVVYSKDVEKYIKDATVNYSDKWYAKGFQLLGYNGGCR